MGKLVRFIDCLHDAAATARKTMPPDAWADRLAALIETFFVSTNATYSDVRALRLAAERLRTTSAAGQFSGPIPLCVVRDFVAQCLDSPLGGEDLVRNAVVFSALRAGTSAPRRIVCLLGMGDGAFPRNDNRAAYDLFRLRRHRGDPSVRIEDRMAFLEAIMSARDRLYISYVGRTLKENEAIPPSTVLAELLEYARAVAGPDATPCRRHKLQPFHPAYFLENSELFSYDEANCRAARCIRQDARSEDAGEKVQEERRGTVIPRRIQVELNELVAFFKNPARVFFHDVLKARLEGPAGGRLAEDEEFSPSALVGHDVSTVIVRAQCDGAEWRAAYRELCERGAVPLEQWGEKWFRERWEEIAAVLASDVPEHGSILHLLREQAAAGETRARATVGDFSIAGKLGAESPGTARILAVDYRCVSSKARDKLVSWIRHLFACAAGRAETRFCILGKTVDKLDPTTLPPLTAERAGQYLAELLGAFLEGHAAVCPFAPGTSYAYAKAWRAARIPEEATPDEADALRDGKGRKAAAAEWYADPGRRSFSDSTNVYFRQAFGPDGPLDEPGFPAMARAVFEPMLSAAARENTDA